MKKVILLFFATTFSANLMYGQSDEKSYENSWFIQGQGGTAITLRDNDRPAGVDKGVVSPHAALSLGKFFSPVIGARLNVSGWESKNYMTEARNVYDRNYMQTGLDLMISVLNLFNSNPDRKFDLFAIGGAAYAHGFKDSKNNVPSTNCFIPRAGLQADYKLSNSLSANLEVMNNWASKNFDVNYGYREKASIMTPMLGLTYRFGKKAKSRYVAPTPAPAPSYEEPAQVAPVTPVTPTPPAPQAKPAVKVLDEANVFFEINSSEIEKTQVKEVEEIVKYLKEYPNATVLLTGFADKKTGNEKINERLSTERVDAVEHMLIKEYGIAPNRITKKAEGDRVQPFSENKKNRVTIGIVSEVVNE